MIRGTRHQTTLADLGTQWHGSTYAQLIQYQIRRLPAQQIERSAQATALKLLSIDPNIPVVVADLHDEWNRLADEAGFWRSPVSELLANFTDEARERLAEAGIDATEQVLFDAFLGLTLNHAFAASTQRSLRVFAGIRKGIFRR